MVPELCLHSCVSSAIRNKPQLEDLWALEVIGIKDPILKESDDEALQKFCNSIEFKEGRYHIHGHGRMIVFVYLIIFPWHLNK